MKNKIRDYRGGGRSSARETAVRVAAGAIAFKILEERFPKLFIKASVIQIGNIKLTKTIFHGMKLIITHFLCRDKRLYQFGKKI